MSAEHEPHRHVRKEIESLLEADTTRLGDVYRLSAQGLDATAIAAELGVRTSNFVVNNRTIAKAMLTGVLPQGPVIQRVVAGAIRKRLSSTALSAASQQYLRGVVDRLEPEPASAAVPESTRRAASPPEATLRQLVDDVLVTRAGDLVDQIRSETDRHADDYYRVVSSESPLDALVRLVQVQSTSRTTRALHAAGRLELSLEAAVVEWAADLPLSLDLIDSARGRLSYWSDE